MQVTDDLIDQPAVLHLESTAHTIAKTRQRRCAWDSTGPGGIRLLAQPRHPSTEMILPVILMNNASFGVWLHDPEPSCSA